MRVWQLLVEWAEDGEVTTVECLARSEGDALHRIREQMGASLCLQSRSRRGEAPRALRLEPDRLLDLGHGVQW